MADDANLPQAPGEPEIIRKIRARTPARLFVGRAGAAYRTGTQMELREAHAAARDAVRVDLDLEVAFGADFLTRWGLFEVRTEARDKEEFLQQPERGRHFNEASRAELRRLPVQNDIQIAIGDGLSVPAICKQVPPLLPLLYEGARASGWTVGRVFVIRHCRVGILNEIGELLAPRVAVLLLGERPGLTTAESLSAYMAHRPRQGQSDANRNLVSNIHSHGVSPQQAALRILGLARQMVKAGIGGCNLNEDLPVLEAEEDGARRFGQE